MAALAALHLSALMFLPLAVVPEPPLTVALAEQVGQAQQSQ
jgi:hypothetical protein